MGFKGSILKNIYFKYLYGTQSFGQVEIESIIGEWAFKGSTFKLKGSNLNFVEPDLCLVKLVLHWWLNWRKDFIGFMLKK